MHLTNNNFTAAVAIWAACAYAGEGTGWPAFRGDMQRTAFYSGMFEPPGASSAWSIALSGAVVSSPSVAESVLYVGCRDSCLYAIEAKTGTIRWKKKFGDWIDASPLVYDKKVIAACRDDSVYVLDASTGDRMASYVAGMQLSSPAIDVAGRVISALGPPLSGLALFSLSGAPGSSSFMDAVIDLPQFSYSSPALWDDRAVVGASDGVFRCVDLNSKSIIWSFPTGGGVYLSSAAIRDSTVYFAPGDYDRGVYAVRIADGTTDWHNANPLAMLGKRTSESVSPAILQDLIRLSPGDREKRAYRLQKTGINVPASILSSGLYKSQAGLENFVSSGGEVRTSSVAVDDHSVYVIQKEMGYPAAYHSIIALSRAGGGARWVFSELCPSERLGYCSSPVVTKNMVLFGWGDGALYGLDRTTGAVVWRTTVEGNIVSSPAIASDMFFIATMKGNLYAFVMQKKAAQLSFKYDSYCYPNPARKGVSHLQVYVQQEAALDMTVYNIAERPVFRETRRLSANEKYTYDWNLTNVANGVYFVRIMVKYNDGGTDKKVLKIAVLK